MTHFPAQLLLASASPRRRELLAQIGVACAVAPANIDETRRPGEAPEDFVRRMANEKGARAWEAGDRSLPVLAADTEVVIDGDVLGKPRDARHGAEMLGRLSGRAHRVLSAVWVRGQGEEVRAFSVSTVYFRSIGAAEIAAYWATGEPADKAGGYAIQGLGSTFVERLDGSYSGVMGLPLFETADLLARVGIDLFAGASRR